MLINCILYCDPSGVFKIYNIPDNFKTGRISVGGSNILIFQDEDSSEPITIKTKGGMACFCNKDNKFFVFENEN